MLGDSEVVIKVGGAETAGSFFLAETVIAPGFPGPPLHRHEQLHDMFYVLEGVLSMHIDGEALQASPGTFVCVPPGVAHTFSNPGDQQVRFLNFNTPAGWEEYMRALGAAGRSAPLSSAAIGAIASRFDFQLA